MVAAQPSCVQWRSSVFQDGCKLQTLELKLEIVRDLILCISQEADLKYNLGQLRRPFKKGTYVTTPRFDFLVMKF